MARAPTMKAAKPAKSTTVSRKLVRSPAVVPKKGAPTAKRIAAKPPTAISYAKEAARTGVELELKNGLRLVLLPVVEHRRNVHRDFFVRVPHEAVDAVFQPQLLRRNLEARLRRRVDVEFVVR